MEAKNGEVHCLNCITKLSIFDSLTEEQFCYINHNRCRVTYNPGETLFKQGTAMTHMLIITEGFVKIYLEGIGNRNVIVGIEKPVTLIGGPGLLTDYKNQYSAQALEQTTACFIDVQRMIETLKTNKEFSLAFIKWQNIQTSSLHKKLIELTQMGMHGRIAGALLYLHNEVYKGDQIRINRQDLADLTAMSKESAIRILKEFKDENIISVIENTIVLNNIVQLQEINLKG